MVENRLFAEMRGADIFKFLRQGLADEAYRKRSYFEASYKIGGVPPTDEERQRMAVLEATTDLLQFLISEGIVAAQERRGKGPPREEWKVVIELLTRAAAQARYALVEKVPEDEQAAE